MNAAHGTARTVRIVAAGHRPAVSETVRAGRSPGRSAAVPLAADLALLRTAFGLGAGHDALLGTLLEASRVITCRSGSFSLASPCQPEAAWWLLRSGCIGVGESSARDGFVERHRIDRGSWLDVSCALAAREVWLDDYWCWGSAELLAIPLGAIVAACSGNAAFAQAYGRVLALALHDLHRHHADVSCVDAGCRLARWLLRAGAGADEAPSPVKLQLRQRKKHIARHLHLTAETFSRTLRELQQQGLIQVDGYVITLRNPSALQDLAYPDQAGRRRLVHGR